LFKIEPVHVCMNGFLIYYTSTAADGCFKAYCICLFRLPPNYNVQRNLLSTHRTNYYISNKYSLNTMSYEKKIYKNEGIIVFSGPDLHFCNNNQ
jgi:hypothetical protein